MSKLFKLYTNPTCPFVHRALIVIQEKHLSDKIEEVFIDLVQQPAWYEETVNPMGTVPTLEVLAPAEEERRLLGHGKFIYESQLIAEYLDDVSEPKSTLRGRNTYESHKIQFFVSESSDLIGAAYTLLRDPFNREKIQSVEDNAVYVNNIVEENQKEGGPFFFDDYFSLADVAIVPFLARFDILLRYYAGVNIFAKAPALHRLFRAAMKRPSVIATTLSPTKYLSVYVNYIADSHPWKAAVDPTTATVRPVLFYHPNSNFSDRVRLAIASVSPPLDVHLVEVKFEDLGGWYAQINYRQTLPALLTGGERPQAAHESWPIMLYLSEEYGNWKSLTPTQRYALEFFYTKVQEFTAAALGGILRNPSPSNNDWEYLEWTAKELVRLLTEVNKGTSHLFHGGEHLDLADLALLPTLVRVRAVHDAFIKPKMDFFKEFPLLQSFLDRGLEQKEAQGIFLPDKEYLQRFTTVRSKK